RLFGRHVEKKNNQERPLRFPARLPAFQISADHFSKTGPSLERAPAAVLLRLSTFPCQTVTATRELPLKKSFLAEALPRQATCGCGSLLRFCFAQNFQSSDAFSRAHSYSFCH
ncbi:MAG: hypothetical protein WA426_16010, partial [Silvibacterium sp.]